MDMVVRLNVVACVHIFSSFFLENLFRSFAGKGFEAAMAR